MNTGKSSSSCLPPRPETRRRKIVTKQPIRQIGTRKEKHERWDPEGPLERIYKKPIYEHVGDTRWPFSGIGDAAMATCALRSAGVPDSDPVIQRMMDNLIGYLTVYGTPDQTWNLAWLTAALAPAEGKAANEWTQKLAGRLLDGQITDGPARGLWGPMSFHPRLMSVLARDYLAADAEVKKRQAKQKEKPTRQNQALVDDAEGDRARIRRISDKWSRATLRFASVELPMIWEEIGGGEKVMFPGYSDFLYNQRSADMESTWVALHALSIAAEYHRLPKESFRPDTKALPGTTPVAGRPPGSPSPVLLSTTVPPENAMAVLARAANALAALRPEDGRWTECNFHQPVTDFDTFKSVLPVPAESDSFPPLPTPVTANSAAQGLAALDSIARAVGLEKVTKFMSHYTAGAKGSRVETRTMVKTAWPNPLKPPALVPALYDYFLAASRPLVASVATDPESDLEEDQLMQLLILAGNPAGNWSAKNSRAYIPSSTRERYNALKDTPNRNWKGFEVRSPVELEKAHFYYYNAVSSAYTASDGAAYATAAAVLYLAPRVENPGAVVQQLAGDPALAERRKEADQLLTIKPKPKPAPVVAKAQPQPQPVTDRPKPQPEAEVPVIPVKPADTKPKSDEKF